MTTYTVTAHNRTDAYEGAAFDGPHDVGWVEDCHEDTYGRETLRWKWVEFVELSDGAGPPLRFCEDCQNLALAIGRALEGAHNG